MTRRSALWPSRRPSIIDRMLGHHTARRRLVALVGTAMLMQSLGSSGVDGATGVVLTPVVSGLDSPVFVTSARHGTGRLFVVEQPGRIRVIRNGVLLPTPFLDISDKVSTGGEHGLLGLAFHPN